MTVHRRDILSLLAGEIGPQCAEFNKKLTSLTQFDTHVEMHFSDSTTASAQIVIGADGIHSQVRKCMLPDGHPAASPVFANGGVYRAIIPMKDMISILGETRARTGQIMVGPEGYLIRYPISGGDAVNVGFWRRHPEPWPYQPSNSINHTDTNTEPEPENTNKWIIPNQYPQLLHNWRHWGATAKKIIDLAPPDVAFWGSFHHGNALEHYSSGRVAVLGDAAHSMTPHQGAGAGQAIEDAYVLGEILAEIYGKFSSESSSGSDSSPLSQTGQERSSYPETNQHNTQHDPPSAQTITAALRAYSAIRQPRAQKVLETSHEAMEKWAGFYNSPQTQTQTHEETVKGNHEEIREPTKSEIEAFKAWLDSNFKWIWNDDVLGQGGRAKKILAEHRSQ
jgi:salicylate hydroxylase